MAVKQVSVFMENREGRLEEVTKTLKDEGINITSLSLAETSDYGILRLIVSDPERALTALKAADFSSRITKVVAVKLSHETGSFHKMLSELKNINIEYMYVLSTSEYASMIVKIADYEKAEKILTDKGYTLLSEGEAYNANVVQA
ncbi:MAG: ACT domain-containing protein [bacterium]|nr:ACT domain-containing protein [bacterium]